MRESHLFTAADEKIIFTNLAEVTALTLDFIALLTPACGGSTDGPYDDSSTFVGEAFLQMVSGATLFFGCSMASSSLNHINH